MENKAASQASSSHSLQPAILLALAIVIAALTWGFAQRPGRYQVAVGDRVSAMRVDTQTGRVSVCTVEIAKGPTCGPWSEPARE